MDTTNPESSRFKALAGAFFRRNSDATIEVWRETPCQCCERPVSVSRFVMSCDKDKWPNAWGLKGKAEPPSEGYTLYSGGPLFCGICQKNWREGRAAETLALRSAL